MPNTREKLIELISQVQYLGGLEEKVADHLIANGVTLQNRDIHWATERAYKNGLEAGKPKWIPVTERLPDAFHSVLAYMPGESPMPTVHEGYIPSDGVWVAGNFKRDPGEVTHWMPLPEPPKGI